MNPQDPSDDIVSRADAFMYRQRSSILDSGREDDDLPLLTDIVTPIPLPSALAPPAALSSDAGDSYTDKLADTLAHALQQRLQAELPTLVEAALQSALAQLKQDLNQGLEEIVQASLRDFMVQSRSNTAPVKSAAASPPPSLA